MENWKQISEYEDYEVSDLGRVRNVKTGRILKPGTNHNGYFITGLYQNGKRKPFLIHQLVAMAFLGHSPCGMKITVDHLNGCRTDNRLENLELVSMRKNNTRGKARLNNTSKFTGVCWNKLAKKWQTNIRINGKQKHLGLFTDELEAANAYLTALQQITN